MREDAAPRDGEHGQLVGVATSISVGCYMAARVEMGTFGVVPETPRLILTLCAIGRVREVPTSTSCKMGGNSVAERNDGEIQE